jgi:peroxiredoxin
MNQKWIAPIVLLVVALIAFFFYNKYAVAPAIDFKKISLLDLQGKPLKFESFKGKKIIVCFSASWCPNCLSELMEINEVKDAQLKDVEVLVISDESLEKIQVFRERTGYPFTFLKLEQSFKQIGINAIPTSYLVNSKQEVKKETVGYVNWADPATSEHMKKLLD